METISCAFELTLSAAEAVISPAQRGKWMMSQMMCASQ